MQARVCDYDCGILLYIQRSRLQILVPTPTSSSNGRALTRALSSTVLKVFEVALGTVLLAVALAAGYALLAEALLPDLRTSVRLAWSHAGSQAG